MLQQPPRSQLANDTGQNVGNQRQSLQQSTASSDTEFWINQPRDVRNSSAAGSQHRKSSATQQTSSSSNDTAFWVNQLQKQKTTNTIPEESEARSGPRKSSATSSSNDTAFWVNQVEKQRTTNPIPEESEVLLSANENDNNIKVSVSEATATSGRTEDPTTSSSDDTAMWVANNELMKTTAAQKNSTQSSDYKTAASFKFKPENGKADLSAETGNADLSDSQCRYESIDQNSFPEKNPGAAKQDSDEERFDWGSDSVSEATTTPTPIGTIGLKSYRRDTNYSNANSRASQTLTNRNDLYGGPDLPILKKRSEDHFYDMGLNQLDAGEAPRASTHVDKNEVKKDADSERNDEMEGEKKEAEPEVGGEGGNNSRKESIGSRRQNRAMSKEGMNKSPVVPESPDRKDGGAKDDVAANTKGDRSNDSKSVPASPVQTRGFLCCKKKVKVAKKVTQ